MWPTNDSTARLHRALPCPPSGPAPASPRHVLPTGRGRLVAGLLAGLLGVAATAGCDAPAGPGGAAPEAARPAAPSAPSRDDACTRLVSAIGYAELRLVPRGKEDEQKFEGSTRGQIAYVEGAIVMYGDDLPTGIRADARALRPTIRKLAEPDTPRPEQVKALKRFRAQAAELVTACGGRPPG